MNRRELLAAGTMLAASRAFGQSTRPATTQETIPGNIVWHDVREWGLEGRAFDDTEKYFDRLPARAKGAVRPEVWNLARNTAGMSAHFQTDAADIYVRYALTGETLAMAHMPATGMSGVDLYGRLDGKWQWLATHRPNKASITTALVRGVAPGKRAYHLNLPLYNGVKSLEIGVPRESQFEPMAPRKAKPILFYGTSITQGGCASRPGMCFVAILGRRLDQPMLNFGFSGNGKLEMEVAQFLIEIDPSIFVIDCIANVTWELIEQRTIPLVRFLREKRPSMPILIVDERQWASGELIPMLVKTHRKKSETLRKQFDALIAEGIKNLHFHGDDVIGTDGEATIDGTHPSDLGFMRYADALEPDLRKLL